MWLIVSALAVVGCGRINFGTSTDASVAEGFTRRNRIVVRGTMLAETLTEFPLYVQLRAPELDLAAIAADGADLRFYADTQQIELPYEIERISSTGVDLWVRVPRITSGVDATFAVYYGDPDAPAGQRAEEVWANDYIAVWHLVDGHDSTSNHLDGAFTGTQSSAGLAGLARDMQLGYLEVPDAPALAMIGANGVATWSAWANPVSLPSITTALIDRRHEQTALDDFRFGPDAAGIINGQINIDPGSSDLAFGGGAFTFGTWSLFSMVRDGSMLRAGVNGMTMELVIGPGAVHPSANPVWLGAGCNNCGGVPSSDQLDGMLDEARIESVARSDGWLRAEYLNLTAALVVVEPFETH
jgi:hypothetical protein